LVSSGRPLQPQSWNRYTYVLNRPLSLVDPNGLDWGVTEWDDKKGHHKNYHWFNGKIGKHDGRSYTAVNFGKVGYRDIAADNGQLVRISNIGIIREVRYAPPGSITVSGQDRVNAAAGNFDNTIPFGRQIREWALGGPGGVDTDSNEYQNAGAVSNGVVQGALLLTGIGEVKLSEEAIGLTKQLASESQVAELLAGQGKAIAGAGTSTILRDAPRLAAEYGGSASEWQKVTSSTFKAADKAVIETHGYQPVNTGRIVELKSKWP